LGIGSFKLRALRLDMDQESLAVKVDHVSGVFRDPDFRFLSDMGQKRLHGTAGFECGNENKASLATCK